MKEAKNVAWKQSTDRRFSTGAVIVCDGVVVSSSANQAPLTSKILINLHKKYCLRRIFKIPSGKKYWVCPGCAGGDHHAEYRASEKLIKRGYDKNKKYDLYLWGHRLLRIKGTSTVVDENWVRTKARRRCGLYVKG